MKDLENTYGAIRIDFRPNEDINYWLYGYRYDEKFWFFDKGDFLLSTNNVDIINSIQDNFITIGNNELFCKFCFEEKKVEKIQEDRSYRDKQESILKEITEEIFSEIRYKASILYPRLNWEKFNYSSSKQSVFDEICTDCYNKKNVIQSNYFLKIINQRVSEYILFSNDESILEEYLIKNIELIEKGMKVIESQARFDNGIIDILAKDVNDKFCVIELKTNNIDKSVVWQAASYQTYLPKDGRVIVIARKYTKGIYNALKNVKNTEIRFYELDNENLLQIKDYQDKVNFITDDTFIINK